MEKDLSFTKEYAIIAQNSATAAAAIYSSFGPNGWDKEVYEGIRTDIFNGTLVLAGAESIVETFESPTSVAQVVKETPAPAAAYNDAPAPSGFGGGGGGGGFSGGGGGGGGAGATVLKFGKHRGKTIAQVAAEDRGWLDWAGENTNNDFVKAKIREFLSA